MTEVIGEYRKKLEEAARGVIKDVREERTAGLINDVDLKPAINARIRDVILPIVRGHREELKGYETEADGILTEISNSIRDAFLPPLERVVSSSKGGEIDLPTNDFDQEMIESSQANKHLQQKIKFYHQASTKIREVKTRLEEDPAYSTVKEELITDLSPYLDLLFEAGLKVNFVIEVKDEESGEKTELHQNDTILLKDIATLLKLHRDARSARSRRDLESMTASVFGRLQIPKTEVPTSPTRIKALLVKKFIDLLPAFNTLRTTLLNKAAKLADVEKGKHESTLVEVGGNYDRVFSPRSEDLKKVLAEFGEELAHRGFKKKKIDKEKQESLSDELVEKTKGVFLELGALRRKSAEKLRDSKDILELVVEHKQATSKLNKKIEAGGISEDEKKMIKSEQEKLDNALVSKVKKIDKEFILDFASLSDVAYLTEIGVEISESLPQLEVGLKMYDFFQELLTEQRDAFVAEWGLEEYLKDIENTPVDELTPWQIVKYVFKKEVAFWTSLHQESDNEFLRKLVDRIKYNLGGDGNGYESAESRAGYGNDWWASSEGRTIMGLLQTYALFATVLHGEHFAEGDKEKLFSALRAYKITREGLYVQTLGHPVYGKYLKKILEISQYWPTLRSGSLPPDRILNDPSLLEGKLHGHELTEFLHRLDRAKIGPGGAIDKKKLLLNERHVIRNGQSIKLAADRFVKDEGDHWSFYPGEETLPTDKVILEADPRWSYQTLSGNIGRVVAADMHKAAAGLIENDPGRFDLEKTDIPKTENYRFAAMSFAQFLFYAFPFLTKIYTDYQLQTQTASHKVNTDELNWNRLFSILGEAIQDADRYGLKSGLMWVFIYYTAFKDGLFGASGNAERINFVRELLIAHQEYVFGKDAMSHIVGRIDAHNHFGSPVGFTTALDMIDIHSGEMARIFGTGVDEDGRVLFQATKDKPHNLGEGSIPAYDWDLFLLSARAYLKMIETAIKDIKPGSISVHELVEGGLNPITQLLFKVWGQFKMWDFGEEDDPSNALVHADATLFHTILRNAHAAKKEEGTDISEIFSSMLRAVESSLGYTAAGKVSRGLGSGQVAKPVERVRKWMKGEGDRWLYKSGKPSAGERVSIVLHRGLGVKGRPMVGSPISDGFSPEAASPYGRRQESLIKFLKLYWAHLSEEYMTQDNPEGLGPWPFDIVADLGVAYNVTSIAEIPLALTGKESEWRKITRWFKSMILHQVPVESPLQRPSFEK